MNFGCIKSLMTGLAMTLTITSAEAEPSAPAPGLEYAFSVRATLAPPLEQGEIDGKRHRFIAITSGTVSGPKLEGEVLPGGGDWQTIAPGGMTEVWARYSFKAKDGTVIAVTNAGVRTATPEVIERLTKGEDVDPSLYYFRTAARFEVAKGPHEWLKRTLFVARGIRKPDYVVIDFYEVK
jgi:Protein of unknown function (DUF3237)